MNTQIIAGAVVRSLLFALFVSPMVTHNTVYSDDQNYFDGLQSDDSNQNDESLKPKKEVKKQNLDSRQLQKLRDTRIRGALKRINICRLGEVNLDFPNRLCSISDNLKATNINEPVSETFNNIQIMHGPSGSGKSLAVELLAIKANCEIVKIKGSSVVYKYYGSGAHTIREKFAKALKLANETNKPVIILIEEIDSFLAPTREGDETGVIENACKEFLTLLDDYKRDPRIFIFATTNRPKEIDDRGITRLNGKYIEMTNSAGEIKKSFIEYSFKQIGFVLSEKLMTELVKNTQDLSIREYNRLVQNVVQDHNDYHLEMDDQLVMDIAKKMNQTKKENKERKKKKEEEKKGPGVLERGAEYAYQAVVHGTATYAFQTSLPYVKGFFWNAGSFVWYGFKYATGLGK